MSLEKSHTLTSHSDLTHAVTPQLLKYVVVISQKPLITLGFAPCRSHYISKCLKHRLSFALPVLR